MAPSSHSITEVTGKGTISSVEEHLVDEHMKEQSNNLQPLFISYNLCWSINKMTKDYAEAIGVGLSLEVVPKQFFLLKVLCFIEKKNY